MVAAYLRGLLPKHHPYGARSKVTEDIILEAMTADILAENIDRGVESDLAALPLLNEKGLKHTLERTEARRARAAELRLQDIYKVGIQFSREMKLENPRKEVSLYQVYQIAEQSGIFDAFDEHYRIEDSRPLL